MSFFFTDRGIFDHPIFARDAYSRRDAWLWLIANACWQEKTIFIQGKRISLNRGQLSFSIRFIAAKWLWNKAKVERFFTHLKTETMIETQTETGQLIITICNYNAYQNKNIETETQTETESGTPPRQHRDSSETKKKKDIKDNKDIKEDTPPTPASGEGANGNLFDIDHSIKPDRFEEFYAAYPRKEAKPSARKAYQRAKTKAEEETIIAGARRYAAKFTNDTRPDARRFIAMPATWLNNERWADGVAEHVDILDDPDADIRQMSPSQHAAWVLRQAGVE